MSLAGELPDEGPEAPVALRVVRDDPSIDMPAAEQAVADLLAAFGRDPSNPHLADTPRRVAAAFRELLTPRPFNLTTFPNDEGYDELVLAHLCMSLRGVQAAGSRTVTSALHGLLRDDGRSRQEFFALTGVMAGG
jgi:GTP cyclohydrolase I